MKAEKESFFSQLSDKEIIEFILNKNEEAIEFLFYHLCKPIFIKVSKEYFSFQVPIDALISEFFIYLKEDNWLKLQNFQFKSKLSTWLTVVAIHFFNKRKKLLTNFYSNNSPIEIEHYNISIDFQLKILEKISKKELYDAINKIKNKNYRWVLLAELSGMSKKEMALELNTKIDNIYNYVKRAKIQLAELLTE